MHSTLCWETERAALIASQTGHYLDHLANYAAARPYYERALAICEKVLGPDHPDTASSLNNLVVDLELLDRDSFMPLFVILAEGRTLDEALRQTINQTLRRQLSPRHVPDAIYQVQEIPYTLSGKKLEIPVRRILLGHPVEKGANFGAMRNPESIRFFVEGLPQGLDQN